ncbi:PiggyBac transposable element-derived protein 3-like [Plakobranchus ocellatus]|uniref:PiggyBac transposable element-derived protein 3-like n=1 Tax=Plakobranchus ocellatus TaxID=259542 RepID=A0AAV4BHW1_9GAST|nr:PiggyBac transposable element-derived protein 3-like [Plakobranchus ocellatus]
MKDKGYDATGTLRANCLNQCLWEGVDSMKKMKRGTMDHPLNADENIILLCWNDNSVVTLGFTKHGISPLKNVQRFSQSEKRHIQVPCPDAVIRYKKHMGGTDRMDQNIVNYRVHIRIKKWWWPLFVFCLNTSTHNVWCSTESQLQPSGEASTTLVF